MFKNFIIAIDGPAGSGKSTIAKLVAEKLGYLYLDTGAMYRAITYAALKNGIAEDSGAVIEMIKNIDLKLKFEDGLTRVFLSGEEVTEKIRSASVNSMVSEISTIPDVRTELVKIQQSFAESSNLVAEGRDTTTVVFPNADLKVYLTGSLEVRAKRRFDEFGDNGQDIDFNEVKQNLKKRDRIDSGREISPLRRADDAVEIDSTNLKIGEEVDMILNIFEKVKV